ncbi:FHA domain-containing protein [Myxococcota bacterium]
MLTFGDLGEAPDRFEEIGQDSVLVGASGAEVLVRDARARDGTLIFQHETIRMMKADRAEQLDMLKQQVSDDSVVLPIRQKAESMWEYITVGRASTADLIVDDPAISNVHAHFEIDFNDGSVSVQDVGSSNGTFVNRAPLQPHVPIPLRSGDCVRFGQSIFYFLLASMLKELLELPKPA